LRTTVLMSFFDRIYKIFQDNKIIM